ncbi:uncharacterized protein LOC122865150 isoform X2 [Siniperca chuatsi]|nr:uncharacterized protein LOC122865150 isoform X2 [Siniperca chuatsi]XP_044029124.1 uncharacterized protein LOC122865150 isoform X2 [Siniperca chuatsi]
MFITPTQPSAMVWGKSWKFNKSLPLPAEGTAARSDWGKCWMFATQQPYSEEGKPWSNGLNMIDSYSRHLWKKSDYRVVESQELDLSLPTEEWQMSWRKSEKNNKKGDTSSVNGENVPKSGFLTLLVQTQHHNEALCSSEWSESWRSTKPASQQDHFTVPNDGLMNESIANKQDNDGEMSSKWEECWRLVNHHGCNKSKLPQVQKSHSPEWADSWRAAMVVFNNHKNSDPSLRQDHRDTYDDCGQQKESHLHKIKKYRDLYLQLCNEFKALSEWSKSWQVTKNNSKSCEEIEKVLKVSPPRVETALEAQKVGKNPKWQYSTSEKADLCYEQLKHNVIYRPKREFTQSKLLHLKRLENVLSASEWRDSWKTLKHRMRMERRMRPDPLRPFRASEKGGDMKPTTSEWKDSWKFTCHPLPQEPELWEQGWSNTPQIQEDCARDQNHFAPVELPKNGPTGERSWGESWRLLRPQHQSEPGQDKAQTSKGRSSVTSHHPDNSRIHRRHARSVSDWQEVWMVSETQFRHDISSLTQWWEAWKCFVFHTGHWTEQVPREKKVDVLMEIQPQKEKISLLTAKAKMSWSFDNQMFRKRYPEKQWSASWRAGSLLKHQPSHYESSGIPGKSMTSTTQEQHATANGHGSKWGRSFRLANPMPHVEQPWVKSSANPYHYTVMWSRGKNIQKNINTNFSNNAATFRLWGNSHRFLQGASAQIKDKTKSKESVNPRTIITKKTKTRRNLYSTIEKEKQSERKWAGCHLLGKTQPRPKKGPPSVKKLKIEDEYKDKFFEEWVESWRFFVQPGSLKKQMPIKSLSGWDESWKFLLPPYQPMNSPKTK